MNQDRTASIMSTGQPPPRGLVPRIEFAQREPIAFITEWQERLRTNDPELAKIIRTTLGQSFNQVVLQNELLAIYMGLEFRHHHARPHGPIDLDRLIQAQTNRKARTLIKLGEAEMGFLRALWVDLIPNAIRRQLITHLLAVILEADG
ncbi:hypothetical protein KJ910_04160 [Patescibacteria group bacterium]|nr:hypothetical protein [Patescibacteria group bacterium]MBU1907040.1 hypothetical protein [Patescibacteria group bacterium]